MTVNDLINQLNNLQTEYKEKEIFIIAENGLEIEPEIKLRLDDYSIFDHSSDNVKHIVLT